MTTAHLNARTGLARQTWWMTQRRLMAFVRQPAYLFITLIQPVVWLFLFGSLFERITELPGFGTGSYLDYLVPGIVVMNAVSSNIWAGMAMLEEIDRGTLNRFLVTPIHRTAILNGTTVEQSVGTAIQSTLIVLLGWAAGASYPGGVSGVIALIVLAMLLGTVFGGFSTAIGMLARERETIIGLSMMTLLPLTFLSTVFMADQLMPSWIRTVARYNPVNWAVVGAREALSVTTDWSVVIWRAGLLAALAALMMALALRSFRAYQRTV
ncbi:MAG: ABC transporter permease [Acidimicrobiia bacterium]